MTRHHAPGPPEWWTGVILLELLDPDDLNPAGCVEIDVQQEHLNVTGETRRLAVMDRERFTSWIANPHVRYVADDTTWTRSGAVTVLAFGEVDYVVAPESLALLTTALHRRLPINAVPALADPGVPVQAPGPNRGTA